MNANRCLKQLILLFACVGAASMAGAAFPTAGGDYSYKGSQLFGDQRTTGQTGDLYITVTEPGTGTPFWPGANDATPYWQIFKGESSAEKPVPSRRRWDRMPAMHRSTSPEV